MQMLCESVIFELFLTFIYPSRFGYYDYDYDYYYYGYISEA